jgi:hypothetical protein
MTDEHSSVTVKLFGINHNQYFGIVYKYICTYLGKNNNIPDMRSMVESARQQVMGHRESTIARSARITMHMILTIQRRTITREIGCDVI